MKYIIGICIYRINQNWAYSFHFLKQTFRPSVIEHVSFMKYVYLKIEFENGNDSLKEKGGKD